MKRIASFILTAALLLGILPFTALAVNNEQVLTSIGHTSAISAVTFTGYSATLTVPYSFTGTLDLSKGLDIQYDTTLYTSVIVSFPSGAAATVGSDPVLMQVTYQKLNDTATNTTDYSISVIRQAATAPVFTGTIAKTLDHPGNVTFTAADFTSKYTKNDGADLAAVVISGSNPSFGTLKIGTSNYNFGDAISVSSLANLSFAATGTGTAAYVVKAFAAGDTANQLGLVDITITVFAGSTAADVISYTKEKDETITFRADDFASVCEKLTGQPLSYVSFTLPSTSSGTPYFDYDSSSTITSPITSNTKYFSGSAPFLSDVTFVPVAGFIGTVTINYTGYDTAGTAYNGTVQITYGEADQENTGSGHFRDVGIDMSWASKAIDYLFEQGIISGVKHGYYNPNASISKGDFTLMLCRAFHLSADSKGNFSDVDANSYYSNAISTAKALGIAKGSNGKFNPNSALSRQDAMVLISRALVAANISIPNDSSINLSKFTDSKQISDYATDSVSSLIKAKIIKGNGDKLAPHGNVSRAEMAVILYRILTM